MATDKDKQGQEQHAGGKRLSLELQEPPAPAWSDMGLGQKAKYVLANVTVEPITLMYIVPNLLSGLATLFLNLEKACRVNLNFPTELCDEFSVQNITNETQAQYNQVTRLVAEMQVWQSPLQSAIPIVLVLFVGSYSDRRHRRKPFILLPLIGDLLMSVGLLLCSLFYLSTPLEMAGIIEAIFPAFTGGMTILFLSVFSYVADISTVETRTFRIGMVATIVSWGLPAAIALSGIAYETLGFVGVYAVSIVIYGVGLVYGLARVKEPLPPVPRPPGTTFVADFFNWRHVLETVKVALRRRPGTRQLQFFLVMVLYVTIQGPLQGESSVAFFFQTQQLKWGPIEQSGYGTYSVILGAVGNFVVTTVLSRWLKLDDCVIGMLAMLAKTVAAPCYAFATEGWQMYAAAVTDIIGAGAVITMRAIATKLVLSDELGKLLALLAVVEAIIPLVFKPVYSKVFAETSDTNVGFFFHIGGVISAVGFLVYLAIYLLQRKQARQEDAENAKKRDDENGGGGVDNTAFQGDGAAVRARGHNGNGVDNTFL
ncbi:hypothetical protein ONE63_010422 [Megalurothrips usitatus]|uniref:Proton-coupled folate transporter-like n=1 Tax=Megalurothrips usitatus TaxID=439358 RepID=A0AAV7XFX5_9NEOP|nr:hypothetical protein ONE63_010422 [Megalurothrips usitatus]